MYNKYESDIDRKSLFTERSAPQVKEEYGIVLDFLQHGQIIDAMRRPVAQLIGMDHLSLLEVAPKKGAFLKPMEKVYIGADKREKIHHITRKLSYNDLTETAKIALEGIIKEAIDNQQDKVTKLFNTAGPISTRQHQLELIPGIGKKHMWAIIEEREKKPFANLEDLKERVSLIPHPLNSVIRRVIEELGEMDKYRIVLPMLDLKSVKTVEGDPMPEGSE